MSELVSVIIPVYNAGRHLNKCLDSIVNQTYKNLEIILVDDGSTDGSERICDEYALKDNRITVIHQENSGVSRARNVGIDNATGNYYHFPDSDDFLELDTYESCLNFVKEYNCDAVVFEHFTTYADHEDQHNNRQDYYGLYEGKSDIVKINFRIAFTCNKFFKAELITGPNDLPGIRFREDIFRGEDGIFSREVLHRADRVWYTDRPFYHYVQSEESACRGEFRLSQLSLLKTIDITKSFFEKEFPEYLPVLKVSEMESCIMLYSDMYLDEGDYEQEQKSVYSRFVDVYKQDFSEMSINRKQMLKFLLFYINPRLYCVLHKLNLKRLEK